MAQWHSVYSDMMLEVKVTQKLGFTFKRSALA
jgi:hypothetical protein